MQTLKAELVQSENINYKTQGKAYSWQVRVKTKIKNTSKHIQRGMDKKSTVLKAGNVHIQIKRYAGGKL